MPATLFLPSFVVALLALCVSYDHGHAAEWYVQGQGVQEFNYDDNIGVTSQDVVASAGSDTSAIVNAGVRRPELDLNLNGRFVFSRFFSEPRLNSNDQFLTVGGSYRLPRHEFNFEGSAVFDTTRTSEFDDTGLGILANAPRQAFQVDADWGFRATRIDTINVFFGYENIMFPDGFPFFDNQDVSGGLGYSRALSDAAQFEATVLLQHFTSDIQTTNSVSLLIGGEYAVSPALDFRVLAGPRLSQFEQEPAGTSTTSVGLSFEGGFNYAPSERWAIGGTLSNELRPSSIGEVRNTTLFGLTIGHAIHRRVDFGVALGYSLQRSPDDDLTGERDAINFEPAISWRIAEDVEMRAGYRLRWQLFSEGAEGAASNLVFINLAVRSPRWTTSR